MPSNPRRLTLPILLALTLISVTPPLATDTALPAFPSMAQHLAVSATTVQLTLTAFMLGMAAGQLVVGAVSDVLGRRKPLLVCTVLALVGAVLCALAPNAGVLIAGRFVHGFFGGGGVVLARAVVADLTEGAETARGINLMMAIGSVAPIVAPTVGSVLLGFTDWRGIFIFLALMVVAQALVAVFVIPESLPREARGHEGEGLSLRQVAAMFTDRGFVGFLLASCLANVMLFGYISGSPFLYQQHLGLSTGAYGLAFGANAIGMTAMSLLASRPSRLLTPLRMLVIGLLVAGGAAGVVLALTLAGVRGVAIIAAMFVAVAAMGFVMGNSSALAIMRVRRFAGTGSAVVGALNFVAGALVSPVVGLGNPALLTGVLMLTAAVLALACTWVGHRAVRAEV